ncbi:major facilitator superfamily domain-containing protein [Xylariomycetidae sp. FL0641]|nr:major facilitator superfamily domain-containing protein [Xylariomycetidae sp. FL0641]
MANTEVEGSPSPVTENEQYSAFRPWQRNCILILAAFAGWFSSISSFIYFPAIPVLARDLNVSVERINLTVTSYLVMAGLSPSITGNAADRFGRRPVFIVSLVTYLGANVGLALQSSFALLFVFRMIQSAGISGTYSVAYGVLGDLCTPAERGGYSGLMSFFVNTPPSLGPLISGLLLLHWRWPAIFWFLCCAVPCCLIPMLFFFPETARGIVGNGSVPARGVNRALLPGLTVEKTEDRRQVPPERSKGGFLDPLAALQLVRFPETAILLLIYGVNYSVYSCLQASLSTLLVDQYHVSGVLLGLGYLPFGAACAIAALSTGKLLDWNFRKVAAESGVTREQTLGGSLSDFPIEKARLQVSKFSVLISAALIIAYGWLFQSRTSLAGPLVMQFFIGLSIQVIFTSLSTLLVDLHRECPSTAQAACNLVRCEMAAGFLAALDALLRYLKPGWCFVLLGLLTSALFPMLLLIEHRGPGWRKLQRSRTAE